MFVKYSPQVNALNVINYDFNGKTITVTYNGVTDTFDFTNMPVGTLDIFTVETELEFCPITYAEIKDDGELYVELVKLYAYGTLDDEYFTTWQEV